MSSALQSTEPRFIALGILTFVLCGLVSIYMSWLQHLESSHIVLYRSIWVVLTLIPYLIFKTDFKQLFTQVKQCYLYLILSTTVIAINWLCFIHAVNHGHLFETSLAYYISPIVSVLFALVLLKEKISLKQVFAIAFVAMAIIYLIVAKGIVPQFSLIIAVSFALYALVSRKITLPVLERMALESGLMMLVFFFVIDSPAAVYQQFIAFDSTTQLAVAFLGVITIVPTGMYISSAKCLSFSLLGMLGFILPTVIFAVGILYFHDPIDLDKAIVLLCIWLSVAIWIYDLMDQNVVVTESSIR